MKLKLFALFVLCSTFVTFGQKTNNQRIARINEIISSTMPEYVLTLEKRNVRLDGCELILTDYLDDNTTDQVKLDLESYSFELIKLGSNPEEFDSPFWILEMDSTPIGFDMYDHTIAKELYNLLLELKNNCK